MATRAGPDNLRPSEEFTHESEIDSNQHLTSTNERSVGQQLTDLQQAHQQGIINDKEYYKLRRVIISKND